MRKTPFLIVSALLFFVVPSCSKNEVLSDHPYLLKKNENITILFSDDHSIHHEGNYYDALLDVKRNYPEKIRSFNIIHSSERDLVRFYEITQYPTLLVVHNQDVAVRIEGFLQKQEISELLEQAILQ